MCSILLSVLRKNFAQCVKKEFCKFHTIRIICLSNLPSNRSISPLIVWYIWLKIVKESSAN